MTFLSSNFNLEQFTDFIRRQSLSKDLPFNADKFSSAVARCIEFFHSNSNFAEQDQDIHAVANELGLRRFMKDPALRMMILDGLQILILKQAISSNLLNYSLINKVEKKKLSEADTRVRMSENVGVTAGISGSTHIEINQALPPSFGIFYETGHYEIDNFIKYSILLEMFSNDFNEMTFLQRIQFIQMTNYLVRKADYVHRLLLSKKSTRFCVGGKHVLFDYIENFERNNLKYAEQLSSFKIIPYSLELNGSPGVGKSTFTDVIADVLHELFPFYERVDMVYNRVNDKFWNGYKQQPIVLFDDQNQNEKLLYNLDNEIIAIGSGQFIYPPMAFDKDTRFSSIFVIYTTNTPLIRTTKANKGAVRRRVITLRVEPRSALGEWIVDEEEGTRWQWFPRVQTSPFNLKFECQTFVNVIFQYFSNLQKQKALTFTYRDPCAFLAPIADDVPTLSLEDALASFVRVQCFLPTQVTSKRQHQAPKRVSPYQIDRAAQLAKQEMRRERSQSFEDLCDTLIGNELKSTVTSLFNKIVEVKGSFWSDTIHSVLYEKFSLSKSLPQRFRLVRLFKDTCEMMTLERNDRNVRFALSDVVSERSIMKYHASVFNNKYYESTPNLLSPQDSSCFINILQLVSKPENLARELEQSKQILKECE